VCSKKNRQKYDGNFLYPARNTFKLTITGEYELALIQKGGMRSPKEHIFRPI